MKIFDFLVVNWLTYAFIAITAYSFTNYYNASKRKVTRKFRDRRNYLAIFYSSYVCSLLSGRKREQAYPDRLFGNRALEEVKAWRDISVWFLFSLVCWAIGLALLAIKEGASSYWIYFPLPGIIIGVMWSIKYFKTELTH